MSSARQFTATGMAARTAVILAVFVVIFSGLLAAVYLWTLPAIERTAAEEKMKLIGELLPPGDYDNALLADTLTLPPTPELGLNEPSTLYRARLDGQPAALVFEAVAPDGYAGKIRLIVAIRADGRIAGTRVVQHRETPGLGDFIEPKKDKNRARPWITQFTGLSLAETPPGEWKVKKDGGRIDYHAGATVTPRAVTKALLKAAQWAATNRDRLFATDSLAPPGKLSQKASTPLPPRGGGAGGEGEAARETAARSSIASFFAQPPPLPGPPPRGGRESGGNAPCFDRPPHHTLWERGCKALAERTTTEGFRDHFKPGEGEHMQDAFHAAALLFAKGENP